MNATMEMPRYRSHKEVWALAIGAIEFAEDGSAKVAARYGDKIVETKPEFRGKFKGDENDLGYYVVYADGYDSWSPTKAFQDGYTLVSE